jgi:hypothetical protein
MWKSRGAATQFIKTLLLGKKKKKEANIWLVNLFPERFLYLKVKEFKEGKICRKQNT